MTDTIYTYFNDLISELEDLKDLNWELANDAWHKSDRDMELHYNGVIDGLSAAIVRIRKCERELQIQE